MFVNIDATAGTLNAESVGPDNQGAFCCLTSMGRVTYKLIGDSLVRQGTCTYDPRVENGPCTPVADNPPALSEAPASTGTPDLNSVKSGFPGQLLMPPPGVLP